MADNLGFTVWLTGMLGAGKTTMANYVAARLRQVGRMVEVLDEDDLGEVFWRELPLETKEERSTVARRLGALSELLTRNGVAVLTACASPYKGVREENRRRIGRYLEVYVDCPTEDLIKRDTTGQYKKALTGEIPNFTGITEPYEPPTSPEVVIKTNVESVEEGGLRIFQALLDLGHLSPENVKVITGTRLKASALKGKKPLAPLKGKPARPEKGKAEKGGKSRPPAKLAARTAKPAKPAKPNKPGKSAKAPTSKSGAKKKKS